MASATSLPPAGHGSSPSSPHGQVNSDWGRKRRRTESGEDDQANDSPSPTHERHTSAENASTPVRKRSNLSRRACNECRQQKLRCDVAVEPAYQTCSRCKRLNLDCRIDANFKRVDKRNKQMEMENELQELRRRLAEGTQGTTLPPLSNQSQSNLNAAASQPAAPSLMELHQGAADSLLELRHSAGNNVSVDPGLTSANNTPRSRKLEKVILDAGQIRDLFEQYFEHYHPFLPILDPSKTPDHFFRSSELLFWTIIAVAARRWDGDPTLLTGIASPLTALIWNTVADVTQNYHVVKALCIICTWPLPTKTSAKDPTFMFAGLMMQIALQTGLHRPRHVQEFSRVKLQLRNEDINDRLMAWAGCNVVSQTVSTGFGQPPRSQWDYTLTSAESLNSLPLNLRSRVNIERLANKISRLVYMNRSDPIGLARDEERPTLISVLSEDYRQLEIEANDAISRLHLQAIGLHLKLCAFFDSSLARTYKQDLHELYSATLVFLNTVLESPHLPYVSHYLMQIILAGGFTLLKLLNSFFKSHTDILYARNLFNQTIKAIRMTSIYNNDLPARLAEVLVQLWRSYGASMRETPTEVDDSLQLQVRCRMSLSVVYDSVWRWREQFVFKTEAMFDPTNVEPTAPGNDAVSDSKTLAPSIGNGQMLSMNQTGFSDSVADWNYEIFEPLMSTVDNIFDFSYGDTAAQGTATLEEHALFS